MAKDLFSNQSAAYAGFRPGYPHSLIDHILQHTPGRTAAWDCATGNGQAATLLAPHFEKVFATDISEKQISNAIAAPNVQYKVATAENSGLADQSIDLVAVAQAYHWLDFVSFEKEVRRVAKPDARIAVWGYGLFYTRQERLNKAIQYLYSGVLGNSWDKERSWIDEHYATIPFPYDALPEFKTTMQYSWDRSKLQGFLNSWSAVQNFMKEHSFDPVAKWIESISGFLNSPVEILFPVFLKMGRINPVG